MTRPESFQLQGNAPQIYEQHKVPAIFRPLAERTLQRVGVHEGARVIDIACGTGIVARLAAEKVGKSGKVVGIDLNPGMIEVARQNSPLTGANLEWHQGDATALPFPEASFDFVFCQQGLQFFPDKLAALEEMRRIMAPGSSTILTIWSSINPLAAAIADGLTRYVSAEAATTSLAPFSFRDADLIKKLFEEAGYREIDMEILEVPRRIGPAEESIPREMEGSTYWNGVVKLDRTKREEMFQHIGEALRDFGVDGGLTIPHQTHLIRASAS